MQARERQCEEEGEADGGRKVKRLELVLRLRWLVVVLLRLGRLLLLLRGRCKHGRRGGGGKRRHVLGLHFA